MENWRLFEFFDQDRTQPGTTIVFWHEFHIQNAIVNADRGLMFLHGSRTGLHALDLFRSPF